MRYSGNLHSETCIHKKLLLFCNYISCIFSLVNVIIYSFQDETFKNAMKKLFEKILPSSPCPTTRAITEQKKNSGEFIFCCKYSLGLCVLIVL